MAYDEVPEGYVMGPHGVRHKIQIGYAESPDRPGYVVVPTAMAYKDPTSGGQYGNDPQAPVDQICDPDSPGQYILKAAGPHTIATSPMMPTPPVGPIGSILTPPPTAEHLATMAAIGDAGFAADELLAPATQILPAQPTYSGPTRLSAAPKPRPMPAPAPAPALVASVPVVFHLPGMRHTAKFRSVEITPNGRYLCLVANVGDEVLELDPTQDGNTYRVTVSQHPEVFNCVYFDQRLKIQGLDITILGIAGLEPINA